MVPDQPLTVEAFLKDYVESAGGMWDEVEPQVYDLLLPPEGARRIGLVEGHETVTRVTFDPEALVEHPSAQLAGYGAPLVDRLLADAHRRGRAARGYCVGLNPASHDLEGRLRRHLDLRGGLDLQLQSSRALNFRYAVFWFQATLVSDRKEQQLVPVGVDLYHGRLVRELECLLEEGRLAPEPSLLYPEARCRPLVDAYRIARQRVVRTVGALANSHHREVAQHTQKQLDRLSGYFADLRSELNERIVRAEERGEETATLRHQLAALDPEERVRAAELRQKAALRVQLQLMNVLVVAQPKLLARARLVGPKGETADVELVWDPAQGATEAVDCAACGRPTLALCVGRAGRVVCPDCVSRDSPRLSAAGLDRRGRGGAGRRPPKKG